jgi:hypothetical protein
MECTLHRWDRRVPTSVREYFNEVRGLSQAGRVGVRERGGRSSDHSGAADRSILA